MVRNIVGTLVEVGKGKIPPEEIEKILAGKDRRKAGPTAPPQGLWLMKVNYPERVSYP
jgi:tRNA pseudouridine38-40 synthase